VRWQIEKKPLLRIFSHQRRPHLSKNFDCFFAHWQLPGFAALSRTNHTDADLFALLIGTPPVDCIDIHLG
jgi:hypothetical protein